MSSPRSIPTALLTALLAAAGASAQEVPQPVLKLQLNFSDPGARSMGLGGAFAALADDATAAFANPAGLIQLTRPEVSIEGRWWSYTTPFTVGGRLQGAPSGYGLDTVDGLRFGEGQTDLTGISFLAFVYPKERWSIALYRHELANFEFSGETQGLFTGGTDCCQVRLPDQRVFNDMEWVNFGLSAALRVTDDLSLGVGLSYQQVEAVARAALYRHQDDSGPTVLGLNAYLPESLIIDQLLSFDDAEVTALCGFLWRFAPRWKLGGVYRQGPEFEVRGTAVAGPANVFGLPAGTSFELNLSPVSLPDIWGIGLSYRSADERLTVGFQWDRVEYSSIVDSLGIDDQDLDDADELHLGGEYVFLRPTPVVALRLGLWHDPFHQLAANERADPFDAAHLPGGSDDLHFAAGIGLAFTGFQLDMGIDVSRPVDTLSISAIYSF